MFQGFVCHITHQRVSPDECLACSLAGGKKNGGVELCPFTPPVVRGLIESNEPRGLMAWSVTELLGCPRKVILKQQVDYWLKPSQAYWAFRGRLAHSIVEAGHHDPGVIAETRFYAEVDGELVTGQPDIIYAERRHLVDYKTTRQAPQAWKVYTCRECGCIIREGTYKPRKGTSLTCKECLTVYDQPDDILQVQTRRPFSSHAIQLSCYRYLVMQGWPDGKVADALQRYQPLQIDTAELVYMDMSELVRVPVELWDLEDTELQLSVALQTLAHGHEDLPAGVYDDPERKWECDYCCVSQNCPRP